MAQGDVTIFNQFKLDLMSKLHNLESDTIYIALTENAINGGLDLTAATADPRWGVGGTTNMSTHEVTELAGTYATGGTNLTAGISLSAVGATIDMDCSIDPTWAQNASNPVDASYAVIYNVTAGNRCIGFMDLTATPTSTEIDMTTGALTITWPSTGIFQLS